MGFFDALVSRGGTALRPDPLDEFWYRPIGPRVSSGVEVNEATAMNYSAVWAATRLLSEPLATLPGNVMEQVPGVGKQVAPTHPVHRVLHVQANPEMDAMTFFDIQQSRAVNWGNAFAEKERNGRGDLVALWPIHPSRLPAQQIERDEQTNELIYKVLNDTGPPTVLRRRDVLHVTGAQSEDGVYGKGAIRQARESIGMGLATEQYGATFFSNGATPLMVLTHPGHLGEEAMRNMRKSWNDVYAGVKNAHKTLVLEEGMGATQMSFSPEDSQFLETRQFNITEIARWYNVPPHMLRELSKSSFNNIEQENLHFVRISLMPWVRRWEMAISTQLFRPFEQRRFSFKFNLNAFLRADSESRGQFYQTMLDRGVYSINDVLELEDRNTIGEDGDLRVVQKNMVPIDKIGEDPEPPAPPPMPEPEPEDEDDSDDGDDEDVEENAADIVERIVEGMSASLQRIPAQQTHVDLSPLADSLAEQNAGFQRLLTVLSERTTETGQGRQDEQYQALCDAGRSMLEATWRRMIRKEAVAARRAARKPQKFLAWLDDFYAKHRENVRDALADPARGCEALGYEMCTEELAAQHCDAAHAELLEASGVPLHQFDEAIESVVSGWENDLAERRASEIMEPEAAP